MSQDLDYDVQGAPKVDKAIGNFKAGGLWKGDLYTVSGSSGTVIQNVSLQAEIVQLKAEKQELVETISVLNTERQGLCLNIQNKAAEIATLKTRIKELEEELKGPPRDVPDVQCLGRKLDLPEMLDERS